MRWIVAGVVAVSLAVAGLVAVTVPAGAVIDSATVVPSPNTSTAEKNFLVSVSCVSTSWCIAVGDQYDYDTSIGSTLAMKWDGTSWALQSSPNVDGSSDNALRSVSCVSTTWCMAVGYHTDAVASQTLTMRWDGTVWTQVPGPNVSASANGLLASVSCVSTSSCIAVGYHLVGGIEQTLAMQWDGSVWTLQSAPNTASNRNNHPETVMCVSSTSCTMVGHHFDGAVEKSLVLRWDGSTWALQADPIPGVTAENALYSVWCLSASSCIAAGSYFDGSVTASMILRWDGASWTQQASPNPPSAVASVLTGVRCLSESSCTAVGYTLDGQFQPLIESWDGSSWELVPLTYPMGMLLGVSCVSESWCAAAGTYMPGTILQSLTVSLIGPEPEPEPTTTSSSSTSTTTSSSTSSSASGEVVTPAFTG